jgi:acyl-coenzyme A thioesterase PaaI-like protein
MNIVRLYNQMKSFPLGKRLFSCLTAMKAPYFFSISPLIDELSETKCVILLRKRRKVLNHIGTVHAIAMCNACELAFGLTMEAGLPKQLRWIPKGMTVRYLKKAETDLRVVCDNPQVLSIPPGDHEVFVQAFDRDEQVVMDAKILVYVSERSGRK